MSRPYFIYGQQLIVPASDTRTARLEELRGKRVGAFRVRIHHLAERAGGIDVRIYQDNVNYFSDLEVGRLDAVLTDTPIALANLKEHPALRSAGAPSPSAHTPSGFAPRILISCAESTRRSARSPPMDRWNESIASTPLELRPGGPAGMGMRNPRRWHPGGIPCPRVAHLPAVPAGGIGDHDLGHLRRDGSRRHLGTRPRPAPTLRPGPVRWLSVAYIEVFRGTPSSADLLHLSGLAQQLGLRLSAGAASPSLGLNTRHPKAENYRAGIQAVRADKPSSAGARECPAV